jgi:hypothetical protein
MLELRVAEDTLLDIGRYQTYSMRTLLVIVTSVFLFGCSKTGSMISKADGLRQFDMGTSRVATAAPRWPATLSFTNPSSEIHIVIEGDFGTVPMPTVTYTAQEIQWRKPRSVDLIDDRPR